MGAMEGKGFSAWPLSHSSERRNSEGINQHPWRPVRASPDWIPAFAGKDWKIPP